MLANGHGPDGLDQRGAGIPGVHRDATVAERPSGHRRPAVRGNTKPLNMNKNLE